MQNKVKEFLSEVFGEVRAFEESGMTWFHANDVMTALEYSKGSMRDKVSKLRKDGVVKCNIIDKLGRNQKSNFINEPNLYLLIFGSKMDKAEEFQDWICGTVIPALRKDGAYIDGEEKVVTGEMSEDELLLKAMTILQTKVDRLTKERDEYKEEVDQFLDTENLLGWDTVAKNLGVGKNTMLGKLRDMKILQTDKFMYNGRECNGESHNVPYQAFMKYFDVKYIVKGNKRFPKVLVRANGQKYLHSKLKNAI